jgi:hypothetical protein
MSDTVEAFSIVFDLLDSRAGLEEVAEVTLDVNYSTQSDVYTIRVIH